MFFLQSKMSSDVDDDQVLPDSLQKLEIVSILSHSQLACKVNNERNQNPFFSELSTTNRIDDRVCINNNCYLFYKTNIFIQIFEFRSH